MEFLELAKSIVKSEAGEEADELLPDLLIDIAQKAIRAYQDYMGQPMDLYLLAEKYA
jgi:hypothetical protein